MLILACRMFFLQIIKSQDYKTMSDKNSISIIFVEPERGKVFDRNNVELAISKSCYRLMLYKQRSTNINELAAKLAKIFDWNEIVLQEYISKMKTAPILRPTILSDYVSWQDVCKFEERSSDCEGVYIDQGLTREYLFADLFAHVIGYMGVPSKAETKDYNLSLHKDFKIGKSGIEKTHERDLIGQFGMKKVEVDAYRTIIREMSQQTSKPGKDLRLTIDRNLQEYIYQLLKDEWASATVIDVTNGDILAMVSTPSFNPNLFSKGISQENWSEILNNKSLPLTNKTIAKLYPPGSPFKMAVALAILQKGINPDQKVFCNGAVELNGRVFKCWKKSGHGHVNLHQAITGSCNCYFYVMGLQAGIDNIHDIADQLGIGSKTNIDLPGEAGGINPDKKWKEKTLSQSWFVGDTINTSIGQGYLLSTPLQMTMMIARVASGKLVVPRLISRIGEKEAASAEFLDLKINPTHLTMVRDGLESVINDPKGTSYASRIQEIEMRMAGKTGTAQVISRDTAENRAAFAKNLQSHSIFTGYAPAHNPKYACTVVVDHGGWGSGKAAPLARDILRYAQAGA